MPNVELSVSEAAKQLKVSPDTIRRWDKRGLIPSRRSKINYRLFNLKDLQSYHNKITGESSSKSFKVLKSSKMSNYNCIELFAGCGGTSLGFHNAGINHELLNDFDFDSVATIRNNKKSWNITFAPVEMISFKDYEVDILQGGFPCQAFSYAGKKRGFDDTRGTLFFQFARCINELKTKPKIIVAENVRGLLNHDNGKTLSTMLTVLKNLGYKVHVKVLKAQFHDVPQKRERLFIFGIRKDLDIDLLLPRESSIMTLGEALSGCPDSEGMRYTDKKYKIMDMVPEGGNWRDLPKKTQKEYMKKSFYLGGGKTGMARRLSWDEPSLTLTCNPAQNQTERCHPTETRPLNLREYARIQTFPDSWKFYGTTTSIYKQIGNAVPVNLAYHIGRCLIAMLDGSYDKKTMEIFDETSS